MWVLQPQVGARAGRQVSQEFRWLSHLYPQLLVGLCLWAVCASPSKGVRRTGAGTNAMPCICGQAQATGTRHGGTHHSPPFLFCPQSKPSSPFSLPGWPGTAPWSLIHTSQLCSCQPSPTSPATSSPPRPSKHTRLAPTPPLFPQHVRAMTPSTLWLLLTHEALM